MMSKSLLLIAYAFTSLLGAACESPARKTTLGTEQKYFAERVQRAVDKFALSHKTDTLDFNEFNGFAWDSLYVFEAYTTASQLNEGWNWIDWSPILHDGGMVPDNFNRFIFTKSNKAVSYFDVSTALISQVHYFKYFKDDRGYLQPYKQKIIKPHFMPANCFERKAAKFILVCPVNVLRDSTEFVYAKADYFDGKQALLNKSINSSSLNLHPILGCGYPNCLANGKLTSR